VGIPSLLVARLPIATPLGSPQLLELFSTGQVFLAWLLIVLVGLILGSFFFAIVAQATLVGTINWRQVIYRLPRFTLQIICLALILTGILLLVSVPASFLLALALFGSLSFGQCAMLLYVGFIFWLFLPLVFSAHGIFVYQYNLIDSIKSSINLTRKALPATILFILAAFIISKGLDVLWLVPLETSWLMLVGVAGHAFVATSLLAASFVYYRDADRWTRRELPDKSFVLG
jgi:hypothetical protein